jgi:bifunctional non-homologous end joining protein LigD
MAAKAKRRAKPEQASPGRPKTVVHLPGGRARSALGQTHSPPLARYAAKRDFERTPEPQAAQAPPASALSFVVQKHWASRLHYDFRLELDGVLLSWAVPKGPCFDPAEKRVAIHVEDHPVAYGGFEGTIPPRQYGAGTVIVWDRGTWEPEGDGQAGLAQGKLVFRLHGEKLAGLWELVKIAKPDDRQEPWILFKKRDAWARPLAEYDVIRALPDSVIARPLGRVEERERREAPARTLRAADLPRAVAADLPATLAPQLATAATSVPAYGSWSCEVKFDGYRLLARIEQGRVRLFTRAGNDWTDKLASLAAALGSLGLKSAWLDGEIVVLDTNGMPDFNALQNAFDSAGTAAVTYFVFDLPFADGFDLRNAPLHARRALLRQVVDANAPESVRFSADFAADPASVLESARALGLEGIVAKRTDAPYASERTSTWLKLKCHSRQEFVIGGFIERDGASREVGSLMLGVFDAAGALQYAGNVGTGWSAAAASSLRALLAPLETSASPFAQAIAPSRWSRRAAGTPHWVKPELVAEVRFRDWTPDGHVRHASFQGLRADKPAREVVREDASALPVSAKPTASSSPGGSSPASAAHRFGRIKVSNPERVIDAVSGLSKLDLVRYYESVAPWMLPHLIGRPVTLVRGPSGVAGELFFQKSAETSAIPGLRSLDPKLWPGHPPLLEVPDAAALVSAAQLNVIEFHTWNSLASRIDKPDRIVFDLDPGEGLSWSRVQEAATLTRALLTELGLQSWLKTSGGKGLHVVVPITPRLGYDAVKAFSQAAVQHLASTIPSRFVAKSGAANRVGRIYVDYQRNGHGATTAAAYSVRARPGLGVSMPIAWEQLGALKSGAQWTAATAREYLSFQKLDPWAGYWTARQTLTEGLKRLGLKATNSPRRTPRT